MNPNPKYGPGCRWTYDIVTPESAEDGDVAERGWYEPGGWEYPLEYDDRGNCTTEPPDIYRFDLDEYDDDDVADAREKFGWRGGSDDDIRFLLCFLHEVPENAEPSTSHGSKGTWYSWEAGEDVDYFEKGERRARALHLYDCTPEQEHFAFQAFQQRASR